ncbi:MAG: sigma 54-interacting transcriptional regulator [Brockia lithotrophica]|uniref:sigma 54-interacting transcriptional regulator n=1 Tax=Hydrogenibacillus schlegelii TaxID=1484 RepID=UPI0019EF5750|nr:sigma 54-interacting transcriptional regulator [Hydrogenibacillus schlegelii]MBE3550946.1 sigma 54-interacting transcriptional regulator [Brockia lithotrophica]
MKRSGKPGKFELAGEATIFPDETGEMLFNMQAKLLPVLQEKRDRETDQKKRRAGDRGHQQGQRKDCAGGLFREGTFREEIFYR